MTMNDNDDAIVATSGLKRKDPPPLSVQVEQAAAEAEDEPRKVTPTAAAALSPYAFRMKELEEYGKAAGENYVMYQLSPRDILENIPGKLDALEVDEVDDLSDEELLQAYDSLTQDHVDSYMQVMIVPRDLVQLQEKALPQHHVGRHAQRTESRLLHA